MINLKNKDIRDEDKDIRAKILNHFSLCSLLFLLCLLSFPSISASEDIVEVKGLRHHETSEYVRVVVDLSGSVEFAKGKLSNPERLFFDLRNAKIPKDLQKNFAINDRRLKTIRLGQFNANTVRIVFDLEVADYDFKIFSLEDPARLIIDIFSKSPADGKKPDTKGTDTKDPEAKKKDLNTEAGLLQRRIVIDPGHGGHDPGAVGPNGLYEKNVVLDIALKVRDIIRKEYPAYQVILTRESDVFIPLPERAKIANNNEADFFLSIHANASPNKQARGIETYFLNYTDDEEALRVAARENAISIKKMKQVQSELGIILASLDREKKRDDSLNLAGYIQNALVSTIKPYYPKANNLGVKQALFYVLVDAKMASALAEVSFISNPEEEKLLSDEAYKQKIAYSLVSGINAYFTAAPQQRMASDLPQQKIASGKAAPRPRGYKIKTVKYARRFR
ncbi:MAG: N-acetylmuramoyl-L-alanine amidase [Nitrospirae bacterium]|nr:N-acetylmuramoyl-L-alanine amidase [Nitrospirota bacterium]